jgi:hypothetical protein
MAAEVLLFDGVAAHYENWKRKADSDPSWAKENPVQILYPRKAQVSWSSPFYRL